MNIHVGILASALIDPRQLKRIRQQAGFTQAGLAKAAGLSQSIVAKVEAGAVDPTYSTLASLSRALNATMTRAGKKAADVMTSPVIGVQEEASLSSCVKMMKAKSISQMPVFSGRRLVGTVTENQIMALLLASSNAKECLEQKVWDHVLPVFAAVGRDTPVEALYSLFRYLPAVLVVAGEKVEGIITKIDLLASGA